MSRWAEIRTRIVTESNDLAPAKVLLTIVAVIPFLVGLVVALVWVAVTVVWQAGVVGFRVTSERLRSS